MCCHDENRSEPVVVGVDIGGTHLRVGCVSKTGKLSGYEKVRQRDILQKDPVEGLGRFLNHFMMEKKLVGKVLGIVIGLPATLNREQTVVYNAPNLEGLDGVPLAERLEADLKIPVFLLKDVSALFYYDFMRFAISPHTVAIGCYVGTGIGNAIYLDGKLFLGANGSAGELGHIPVWESKEPCGCGNKGCAEPLVGGKGLERIQMEYFPDTKIHELFLRHGRSPVLCEYIQHLALPIASEVNILDPQVLILGGGVISMEGFPVEELIEAIRVHARKPFPEKNLKILISENSGENGVIGAGLYAWDHLIDKEAAD